MATSLGNLLSGSALSLAAEPGIAGPLFDLGRNRAAVDGSRARTIEAVANYRRTLFTACNEVEQNLALASARERQHTAIEALVAANADTAAIARIQYRRCLTDFLGVLDAQQPFFAAVTPRSKRALRQQMRSLHYFEPSVAMCQHFPIDSRSHKAGVALGIERSFDTIAAQATRRVSSSS